MKIISRQVSVLAGSTCQFQGEDRGIKLIRLHDVCFE